MFVKARSRVTYANVMATVAMFIALGGGAYAATKLPANSVGAQQIKRGAVNSSKVADRSLGERDFKPGAIQAGAEGPQGSQGVQGIPGVQGAKGDKGDSAPPPEAWREVGQPGQPAFGEHQCGAGGLGPCTWQNYSPSFNSAAFFKDSEGVVHLKGLVALVGAPGSATGDPTVFTLPAGWRPAKQEVHAVETHPNAIGRVDVAATGEVIPQLFSRTWVSLDGITFRAAG